MKYLFYYWLIFPLYALDYNTDISPIIYNNCTSCHRVGQIGAFLPLTNYEEVFNNRFWIAYAIAGDDDSRHGDPIMPPWPADREYSTLLDAMYLTEDEIHIFSDWVDSGAMQGDPLSEAPMPDFPEGSAIGDPDIVIQMEEPYFISGNYEDDYRCFIINLEEEYDEAIDLAAMEFIPGNLEAVHHAIIVAVPAGSADALDAADEEYGYQCYGDFGTNNISDFLGGYAPGTFTREWPQGLAQQIPANSDLIMQVHYAPLTTDQLDQSSINIFFKQEPVERYVQEHLMVNYQFALPPNEITEVSSNWYIGQDISLIQFLPHSHLLGKTWEIYAETPLETIPIIRINDWDFDWQFWYSPEYMMHLPAGTTVHASCTYDNTSNNPNNPSDPPQWTFWGDDTNDEMFFVPFRYVIYEEGDENIFLGDDAVLLGDLNNDGSINVLDVVALTNCVLEANCFQEEGDVNSDGTFNVLDIVSLVGWILG
tara:strand:- start:1424 stop:2863 length:1440 start_codon:yes stop_codon:yes gene_type:complete